MEIIFENESLKNIIIAINSGIIDSENPEDFEIISEDKPNFIVKFTEVDISQLISTVLEEQKDIKQTETTCFDFIVYHIKTEEKTLLAISLFELVIMGNELVNENAETINSSWDLNSKEWKLLRKENEYKELSGI